MVSRQTTHIILNFFELLVTGSLMIWILFFKARNITDKSFFGFLSLLLLALLFLNSFVNLVIFRKLAIFEEKNEWVSISLFVLRFFAILSFLVLAFVLILGFSSEFFSTKRTIDSVVIYWLLGLFCLTVLTAMVLFNQYSFSLFQKRKHEEQKAEMINSIGIPDHE